MSGFPLLFVKNQVDLIAFRIIQYILVNIFDRKFKDKSL